MVHTLGKHGGPQDSSQVGTHTGTRRQTGCVTQYASIVHVVQGTCLTHSTGTIRQVTYGTFWQRSSVSIRQRRHGTTWQCSSGTILHVV